MKLTIKENERGLLYKNGCFAGMLAPGSFRTGGGTEIEVIRVDARVQPQSCTIDALLRDKSVLDALDTDVTVADGQVALHYVDGSFTELLYPGRYLYLKPLHHEVTCIDITEPLIGLAPHMTRKLPVDAYTTITVGDTECAKLFYDGKFVRLLEAGVYRFWNGGVTVTAQTIDMRISQLVISGQELLTSDKISLRVSFVCRVRITDPVKITAEIDDYSEHIRCAAQLAMREFVSSHTLDGVLNGRAEMTDFVSAYLAEKAKKLYVEISDCGVRDIILPGEIRSIMNTVLIAEKQAQANVITRREEVASTRSLLNTAKLMEENPTLYHLKEMEQLEKISEKVGSLTLNVGEGGLFGKK